MKRNKEKGITLIALVVTIIVLLILATVSIAMLTGENGILKNINDAKILSKIKEIEEIARLEYMNGKTQEIIEGKNVKIDPIINSLKEKGYIIKEIGDTIKGIKLSQNEVKMNINSTCDISYEIEHEEGSTKYFVEIQNKYYEIKFEKDKIEVSIDGKKLDYLDKKENIIISASNNIIDWKVKENGKIELSTQSIPGNTVITVKEEISNIEAKCNIEIKAPVTELTISQNKVSLEKGKKVKLIATVTPDNTTDEIIWNSSNEEIVTVNNGEIESKEWGSATITATCGDKIASCNVMVTFDGLEVIWINRTGIDRTIDGKTTSSNNPKIPTGFCAVNDNNANWNKENGTSSNVNEGLVIKNITDRNEFVWVPVLNAVAEDMNGDGNINTKDIDLMIAKDKYPMAIKTDATNYRGVLYDFSLTNGKVVVSDIEWSSSSTSYREPDVVSSYDNNTSYNNVGITKSLLQTEFNTMVEKVSTNGGFWVGRYETSNMNASNDDVKIGVIKGATTGVSNVNWYRMYQQQKNYKNKANLTLTSSMIWGSQWDQIMIWMRNVENEAQKSFYVVNAVGMGNHNISGVNDGYSDVNNPSPTGCYEVKNIYDLSGNVWDWTLESSETTFRDMRGGGYRSANVDYTTAGRYSRDTPYTIGNTYGTRAVLY